MSIHSAQVYTFVTPLKARVLPLPADDPAADLVPGGLLLLLQAEELAPRVFVMPDPEPRKLQSLACIFPESTWCAGIGCLDRMEHSEMRGLSSFETDCRFIHDADREAGLFRRARFRLHFFAHFRPWGLASLVRRGVLVPADCSHRRLSSWHPAGCRSAAAETGFVGGIVPGMVSDRCGSVDRYWIDFPDRRPHSGSILRLASLSPGRTESLSHRASDLRSASSGAFELRHERADVLGFCARGRQ